MRLPLSDTEQSYQPNRKFKVHRWSQKGANVPYIYDQKTAPKTQALPIFDLKMNKTGITENASWFVLPANKKTQFLFIYFYLIVVDD